MSSLAIEAIVVGLANGIVGSAISLALMYADPKFSLKEYTFWPQVFLSFFLAGVILHLLFEGIGANKYYCNNGYACKKRSPK